MEILSGLSQGFEVALNPWNLLYVLLGVFLGTVIGALPGFGPAPAIALLLPFSFSLPPEGAIIMLAGIYYGAMYGGRIPAILLRLPGDAAHVVTTIDGYPLAQQGRAGAALTITAIGSFIGGTVAIIGLTLFAPLLAGFATRFGPHEFFALTLAGLLLITSLGTKSVWRSLTVAGIGLLLATVGQDPIVGVPRFTFGVTDLLSGLDLVAIAIGLFGIGEIIYNSEQQDETNWGASQVSSIWPSGEEWARSRPAIIRGSFIGFVLGLLPGGGGVISSLTSYGIEKRVAKEPERFGQGAIEGVAGPDTADNSSSMSAFIPLLTLGIPPNVVMALIFGALLIQGITPGPLLIQNNPEVFWGVIASMYIGNIFLVLLNVPLIGLFVKIVQIPRSILSAGIILLIMVGVYSLNNSVFDLWVALAFGIIGYVMKKSGFEPGPLVLAFVLGPIMEAAFRRSMVISNGDLTSLFTRPLSGTIFALIVVFIVIYGARMIFARHREQN